MQQGPHIRRWQKAPGCRLLSQLLHNGVSITRLGFEPALGLPSLWWAMARCCFFESHRPPPEPRPVTGAAAGFDDEAAAEAAEAAAEGAAGAAAESGAAEAAAAVASSVVDVLAAVVPVALPGSTSVDGGVVGLDFDVAAGGEVGASGLAFLVATRCSSDARLPCRQLRRHNLTKTVDHLKQIE